MSRREHSLVPQRSSRYRLFGALLVLPAVGFSQTDTAVTDGWNCELCPTYSGWEIDLKGGPAFVLDDAFRFGDYTGLDEKATYLFGDIFGRYRGSGGNYALFEGYSRGSGAYGLFAEGGQQSVYTAHASIQSIPRRFFNSTRTPFSGVGTANLTLPSDWVRGPTTQQMTELQSSPVPVAIGFDRQHYRLGLDLSLRRDWELSVDFRRQEREGVTRSSGSMLFTALEFASPIDYTTDDFEVSFIYAKDNWQASASYFGSVFKNDNASVSWDNPYTAINGANQGQQALAPENEANRVTLAGSVLLPARTTLNGHVSIGQLEQDTRLLPYTTNPTLATSPLPVQTAGAEVDTFNVNLRAVTSPWRSFTLEAELRLNEFDNKTPVNTYDYIVTDIVAADAPAESRAYDYDRRKIKLRGEYRMPSGVRVGFGVDTERFERSFQDRHRTNTDRLWATLRARPGGVSEFVIDVFTENRDGSSYETVLNPTAPENPLMRKYNMADRERGGVKMRVGYFGGAMTDFGLEFEFADDRYDASLLGLTNTDYVRIGADFSYLFSASGSVYANVYNEQIDTDQANSQTFSLPDWTATTEDNFTTAVLGTSYAGLFDKLDAELELGWHQAKGRIASDTSGLESTFPDLRSDRRTVRLGLSYPLRQSLRIGLDYYYEKLSTDDWALDGVDLDTVPSLMSLGANAWNYSANVIYLNVQYTLAE